jgi:hypothetical protein
LAIKRNTIVLTLLSSLFMDVYLLIYSQPVVPPVNPNMSLRNMSDNISNQYTNSNIITELNNLENLEIYNEYTKELDDIVMHVTLDIFSGRPNPRWELSQEQSSEFLKKISKLETKENFQDGSDKDGLGYRGVLVEEENVAQKSRKFEVYSGIVNVVENDSSYALDDKGYGIERWLLQTAPNNLDDLVKYVKQEIENRS